MHLASVKHVTEIYELSARGNLTIALLPLSVTGPYSKSFTCQRSKRSVSVMNSCSISGSSCLHPRAPRFTTQARGRVVLLTYCNFTQTKRWFLAIVQLTVELILPLFATWCGSCGPLFQHVKNPTFGSDCRCLISFRSLVLTEKHENFPVVKDSAALVGQRVCFVEYCTFLIEKTIRSFSFRWIICETENETQHVWCCHRNSCGCYSGEHVYKICAELQNAFLRSTQGQICHQHAAPRPTPDSPHPGSGSNLPAAAPDQSCCQLDEQPPGHQLQTPTRTFTFANQVWYSGGPLVLH